MCCERSVIPTILVHHKKSVRISRKKESKRSFSFRRWRRRKRRGLSGHRRPPAKAAIDNRDEILAAIQKLADRKAK